MAFPFAFRLIHTEFSLTDILCLRVSRVELEMGIRGRCSQPEVYVYGGGTVSSEIPRRVTGGTTGGTTGGMVTHVQVSAENKTFKTKVNKLIMVPL